jgi:hypothetical protein
VQSDDLMTLTKSFGADVRRGLAELSGLGYDATFLRRMLDNHGPVDAARRLVMAPSDGLMRLKALERLDMSVEMWVLLPWYEPLFSKEVRDKATRKLRQLGVDVPAEIAQLVAEREQEH